MKSEAILVPHGLPRRFQGRMLRRCAAGNVLRYRPVAMMAFVVPSPSASGGDDKFQAPPGAYTRSQ
jgi:hypothetical protein